MIFSSNENENAYSGIFFETSWRGVLDAMRG